MKKVIATVEDLMLTGNQKQLFCLVNIIRYYFKVIIEVFVSPQYFY